MAVLPMKQVLLCALKKNRKQILELLQRQGVVEISHEMPEDAVFQKMDMTSTSSVFERNSVMAAQSLEILNKQVPLKQGMLSSLEGRKELSLHEYEDYAETHEEMMKIAFRIQECSKQIAESGSAIPKLETQIETLVPWLGFDLPLNYKGTKKTVAFIGSLPGEIPLQEVYELIGTHAPEVDGVEVTCVSSSKEQTCLFILCARADAENVEDALRKMNFARPQLTAVVPSLQKKNLEEEIQKRKNEVKAAQDEIASYSPKRESIKFVSDYYRMRAEKYEVLSGLLQSKRVFVLTGFIPEKDTAKLESLLTSRFELAVEFEDPSEQVEVPIMLRNNRFADPVESVLESYSMPARGELDPTAVMAPFYYILFGLMLSDAAYGLIMVIACGYCLLKYKNMEAGIKKMLHMLFYCGISTTFWGFMFGSFFGDAVNVIAATFFGRPDIRLAPIWFEPVNDPMRMLVFAFVVGIIHLFTGLGVKFYANMKAGHWLDAIYDSVFWYMLVGGAIVYLLTMEMFTKMLGLSFTLPAALGPVCTVLAVLGALGIVLTSGRESKNWFKRILKGIYGVYNVTGYLSDILSYSRLLALGLATSVISTVFNKMGSMVGNSIPGVIVFILVFLAGHSLNLAINALGAYVHTNRLQFVEFFGKFYEGGGRKFAPFAIHTKYYKVKEDI
ncbi:MAG: V-type ATP synthase subunit I [Hungatella sp.]